MKLHHIGMYVKSLKASKEFYQIYFGFEEELNFRWGSENILFLKKGCSRLELIEEPGEENKRAFLHIALVADDLIKEVALVKEKGLMPVEGPLLLDNGWKVVFFFGPDGEIIELVEE
ncbi:VOC family protein [Rossellomorea aquimaris]|uniref:VOC family protein n=1 Tax=Rossellomorea aquimaris TaxID=189382 RepID=UPI001CD434DA|nr:VOC family protein [Rossellomorea aquimaris]MCA1061019.1 VOC family protein [Rossellomorea aquimaris]